MTEKQSPRPAPYPAETRAKGWRFELDYERIEQSDTWALAAEVPMAQHALVMMWMMAWKETPCGSFSADEAVIRAKLRIPADLWAGMRDVLMRGWWLASDGRLYHDTLVQRVGEMMRKRRSDADRQSARRSSASRSSNAQEARESHATTGGLVSESSTGTGTSTEYKTEDFKGSQGACDLADDSAFGDELPPPDAPPPEAEDGDGLPEPKGAPYGLIAKAIKEAGVMPNAGHPRFRALVDAGADTLEFLAFVDKAKREASGDPFPYIVGAVWNERKRAKATAGQLHHGAMPAQAPTAKAAAKAAEVQAWFGTAFQPQPDEDAQHGATPLLG